MLNAISQELGSPCWRRIVKSSLSSPLLSSPFLTLDIEDTKMTLSVMTNPTTNPLHETQEEKEEEKDMSMPSFSCFYQKVLTAEELDVHVCFSSFSFSFACAFNTHDMLFLCVYIYYIYNNNNPPQKNTKTPTTCHVSYYSSLLFLFYFL